jgi:hypothetical protein
VAPTTDIVSSFAISFGGAPSGSGASTICFNAVTNNTTPSVAMIVPVTADPVSLEPALTFAVAKVTAPMIAKTAKMALPKPIAFAKPPFDINSVITMTTGKGAIAPTTAVGINCDRSPAMAASVVPSHRRVES